MNALAEHSITVITVSLSVITLVACYVPRVPAAIIGYGALVCAHCLRGEDYVSTGMLIFWGIVTLIIIALRWLQPMQLTSMRSGVPYLATGAIAGTLLGIVVSPASAPIIIGASIGVLLAALAYMRTPGGLHYAPASGQFVEYLCAKGFPIVAACATVAISLLVVLSPR